MAETLVVTTDIPRVDMIDQLHAAKIFDFDQEMQRIRRTPLPNDGLHFQPARLEPDSGRIFGMAGSGIGSYAEGVQQGHCAQKSARSRQRERAERTDDSGDQAMTGCNKP